MRDTIINAKREREVNVNSTLFKVSALIYDMIGGNVDAINPLKLLELYQDITAIMNEITAGRLTMTVNLATCPVYEREVTGNLAEVKETPQAKSTSRIYRNSESGRTVFTQEDAQIMTPAERAAEVMEKKKRGRPRKNPVPET